MNEELAKLFERKQVYYSIYASDFNKFRHQELIELSNNSLYFKLYHPVPFNELVKKAESYDYGVLFADEKCEEIMNNNLITEDYYGVKFRYGATNKYFDYIDAGLPIIASAFELFLNIFARYGMVYFATPRTIESELEDLKERLPELKKNIKKNINKLSIEHNISRLIEFYKEL